MKNQWAFIWPSCKVRVVLAACNAKLRCQIEVTRTDPFGAKMYELPYIIILCTLWSNIKDWISLLEWSHSNIMYTLLYHDKVVCQMLGMIMGMCTALFYVYFCFVFCFYTHKTCTGAEDRCDNTGKPSSHLRPHSLLASSLPLLFNFVKWK